MRVTTSSAWLDFLPRRWLDRALLRDFLSYLWHRFVEDRCFETASALAYTTVFALVPLAAAVLGVMSSFPVFQAWTEQLTAFLFANFVPASARAVGGLGSGFSA
jgi:membrane protein